MENRIYPVVVNTLKMRDTNFEIDYPQVTCLNNPVVQESINRTIIENVYAVSYTHLKLPKITVFIVKTK